MQPIPKQIMSTERLQKTKTNTIVTALLITINVCIAHRHNDVCVLVKYLQRDKSRLPTEIKLVGLRLHSSSIWLGPNIYSAIKKTPF